MAKPSAPAPSERQTGEQGVGQRTTPQRVAIKGQSSMLHEVATFAAGQVRRAQSPQVRPQGQPRLMRGDLARLLVGTNSLEESWWDQRPETGFSGQSGGLIVGLAGCERKEPHSDCPVRQQRTAESTSAGSTQGQRPVLSGPATNLATCSLNDRALNERALNECQPTQHPAAAPKSPEQKVEQTKGEFAARQIQQLPPAQPTMAIRSARPNNNTAHTKMRR
ncbi:unannotated protein [freshwater metagenome]|uniref:Unannotated protein n=1 Tax=freshwater metagenome TaxID=449393 RepID=A0A6J6C885_9ZZZZ